MLTPERIAVFHQKIFSWYADHKRDLPWRHTTDPYAVLVAEVMLQQTSVDRVVPKYLAWLAAFPSFSSLASASSGFFSLGVIPFLLKKQSLQ